MFFDSYNEENLANMSCDARDKDLFWIYQN